jgi:uncharacterized protein (DUF427 family)
MAECHQETLWQISMTYETTENTMWNYLEALKAAEEIDYSAMVRLAKTSRCGSQ